jgi:carbon-monoxide dehydrogenase large subunit
MSTNPTPWRIGGAPRRVEDARLLRGLGRYSEDQAPPGALHAAFLRSPHAAARIDAIDTADARALPGVVAVFTGADLADVGALPCLVPRQLPDGAPMPRPPWLALPTDAARHVGDAVAMVVATTAAAARDGVEAVAVAWDPLPAVTDAEAALATGAPEVWPGLAAGNLCFEFRLGDHAGVAAAPRRMSSASMRGSAASAAPRWNRAPPSPNGTRPRGDSRCAPARRGRMRCATCSPRRWACRSARCA